MKQILLLIVLQLLLCFEIHSQPTGEVIYTGYWTIGSRVVEGQGLLLFNDSIASISRVKPYRNKKFIAGDIPQGYSTVGDSTKGYFITYGDTSRKGEFTIGDPFSIFYNLASGDMYQELLYSYKSDSSYLLHEKLRQIDWQIEDEYAQIGNFECQKAKATLKGRHYTVWFTSEIPVSLGPWKLNGLPGLIVEATDSKNEVWFKMQSVVINGENQQQPLVKPNIKVVPFEEYVELEKKEAIKNEEKNKTLSKQIESKAPKGSKVRFKIKVYKTGLELDY